MMRLPPQAWLSAPATQKVINALETARAGSARFVGGCVRNALLGQAVTDIDIATQFTPDMVQTILTDAGCAVHPTGIEHGTVTVVADSQPFEVTTLRRDVETDGRRAVVAFTEDWTEDASRRDFTINALYADRDGLIHDPTGRGLADIGAPRLVFVGDAETRLREDYLRILRFFRFHAWYGAGEPDADGLAACAAQAAGLSKISAERIWMETKKLLAAANPISALRAMATVNVLDEVFKQPVSIDRLEALIELERTGNTASDALLRVIAMIGGEEASAGALARRMKASNEEALRLKGPTKIAQPIGANVKTDAVFRLAYVYGVRALSDKLMLMSADDRDRAAELLPHVEKLAGWDRPELPVRGADVVAAGVKEGPSVGPIVRQVEQEWVASDFTATREALLSRIDDLAQQR